MRKKSHISVAKGVINGLDIGDRINHRFAFYVGSIWPDCIPSFITKRHCIDDTFEILMKRMNKFINKFNPEKDMNSLSTWRMGVVLHYIADYFTFPHNTHYTGSLKEHCIYEEKLKHRMYRYIDELNVAECMETKCVLPGVAEIERFIREKHEQYMNLSGNVDDDCKYAVLSCISVMASLLSIVSIRNEAVVSDMAA
ncbi:MAG: zinc dependent phospholipase C family protein [Lachnospiraceae bacterium]|nr:zinc dependent phospholipase C family protein [Lachnospiraceae bacterium]